MNEPAKKKEETLDTFWLDRFKRVKKELIEALEGKGITCGATIAILPYGSPRFRYCRGMTLNSLPADFKPSKVLQLVDDSGRQSVPLAIEINRERLRSLLVKNGFCDIYSRSGLKGIIEVGIDGENLPELQTPPDSSLSEWLGTPGLDHDAKYLWELKEGARWELKSGVKVFFESRCADRQQAYNILAGGEDGFDGVLFPKKGIAVPVPKKLKSRDEDFHFVSHSSYRHDLAVAYWLDYCAFPFSHIASWPVASYQPCAWIMVVAELDSLADEDIQRANEESANKALASCIPLLKEWELKVEAELYAFRLTQFQECMGEAFEMRDKEQARIAIEKNAEIIFHYSDIGFARYRNLSWELDRLRATSDSIQYPDKEELEDFAPFAKTEPDAIVPILMFDKTWNSLVLDDKTTDGHHEFLLEQAYRQLCNETRLLSAAVERNLFKSAGPLARFLVGENEDGERNKDNSREVQGFVEGMRQVMRVYERLSKEAPLGSERLARLCKLFSAGLQTNHDLFAKELDEEGNECNKEPLELKPRLKKDGTTDGTTEGMATVISEILHEPEVVRLVEELREDFRDNKMNGHLLLRPLSPSWLAGGNDLLPSNLRGTRPLALTAAMIKAWSRGVLWAPHLYLLRTRCEDYNNVVQEEGFVKNALGRMGDDATSAYEICATRIMIDKTSYSPDQLLALMMAFSDLFSGLSANEISVSSDMGGKCIVKTDFIARGNEMESFEEWLAKGDYTASTNNPLHGNVSSALNRLCDILDIRSIELDEGKTKINITTEHDCETMA